jgi:hypothetical protein
LNIDSLTLLSTNLHPPRSVLSQFLVFFNLSVNREREREREREGC